jgi:hypothetical protein
MAELAMLRAIARVYFNTGTTLAYGFTREVTVTYDYKDSKKYYNQKTGQTELKEMLLVDKIGRITGNLNTVAAMGAWPFMLGEDLVRLDCAVKGRDPSKYRCERKFRTKNMTKFRTPTARGLI